MAIFLIFLVHYAMKQSKIRPLNAYLLYDLGTFDISPHFLKLNMMWGKKEKAMKAK